MPTPAKTSRDQLVALAIALIDTGGIHALTVSAVAHAAGIRGPSIYKHFTDRLALLKAVEIDVLASLEKVLRAGVRGRTSRQRLMNLAAVYRREADPDAAAAGFKVGLVYALFFNGVVVPVTSY